MFVCAVSTAGATSRIKDLANVEGIRQNQLIGYGLVVGLNGTGDTLNNTPFTKQSLQGMLERLGINIRGQQIRTGNVAAVMVSAMRIQLTHWNNCRKLWICFCVNVTFNITFGACFRANDPNAWW
jgi:flagellar basal body P-ring protein FlgI